MSRATGAPARRRTSRDVRPDTANATAASGGRARLGRPRPSGWPCGCDPHVARMASRPAPLLFMLHGVDCPRPVEDRQTIVVRLGGQEAPQVRSEGAAIPPTGPAGWPGPAGTGTGRRRDLWAPPPEVTPPRPDQRPAPARPPVSDSSEG